MDQHESEALERYPRAYDPGLERPSPACASDPDRSETRLSILDDEHGGIETAVQYS